MKIAILTLPLHTNYGGILQAYALQTVLERMGHQVEVLQKRPGLSHPLWLMPLVYGKRLARKILKDWDTSIFAEQKLVKANKIIRQHTDCFIQEHINLRMLNSLQDIAQTDYEAIVVGSDQIWRRIYYAPQYKDIMLSISPEDAFLCFAEGWDIKRIAYAASFGVDSWEYSMDETYSCAELINKFDYVSIREKSGVENCIRYFGCEARHVLDPTMLLDKNDYIQLVDSHCIESELSLGNSMFCYILDADMDKNKIIQDISSRTGFTTLYMTGDASGRHMMPSVEEWISAVYNSPLVVTDSFHACVFSIIFNKPFIAIGNAERGLSRFNSLLELFGLEDRLIDKKSRIYPAFEINRWDEIKVNLALRRKESLNFLTDALK